METENKYQSIKHRLHVIITEADTPAGKAFDVILLVAILFSVLIVMLDSVASISENCYYSMHDDDAKYCKICGHSLSD